jgi:GR25 family glycosyltransferase involved in LPS biosynthesis
MVSNHALSTPSPRVHRGAAIEIRVINLDRTPDRLADFRAHNPHLPEIARVAGVDGRTLDRAGLVTEGLLHPESTYTAGALGNALSHMTQWQAAIAADAPLTVLEDDAVLCANFPAETARIIAALGDDWDYILWGHNFDTVMSYELLPGLTSCTALFDQARMRQRLPFFHRRLMQTSVYRLNRALGIPAYTVSPRGAKKLLAFCRPIRPLDVEFPLFGRRTNFSIDYMLNGLYADIAAYVAMPALALTANDLDRSTVQDPNDADGPANPAKVISI